MMAAVLLVVIDRLTKAAVMRLLPLGTERPVLPGVRLSLVRHRLNPAIVRRQRTGLIALFAASFAALAWLVAAGMFRAPLASVGVAFALAGAGCNLWDRVRGYTLVDFIRVLRWPAFNVADMGICLGSVVALVYVV